MRGKIPKEAADVMRALAAEQHAAYLVGGCVRDLLLGREPKDWDVATDATPEEVQRIFSRRSDATSEVGTPTGSVGGRTIYENQFGTVGVKTDSDDPRLKVVEVTTFRLEGKYTDKRHPDEVKFAKTIEEDLSRRDFTINAIAMTQDSKLVDPFRGQDDLRQNIIRTVGDPAARFNEDALRLLRAVRLAAELSDFSTRGGPASGWQIEGATRDAVKEHAGLLEMIAKERIRDEFVKMVETPHAAQGVLLLEELGLLRYVLPELREGIGVGQDKHHIYAVFEHSVRALDYAAKKNYSLEIRLASLLHDAGKPRTKAGESPNSTFYNHEMVGAKMAARALDRLRFPSGVIERTVHLVRWHMFYYNVGEVSAAGVRRFLARVGPENVDDLIKVREADRIGSGVPKAVPYKLRHLLFMIEKVKHDPISPKMLKVNGEDVMKILGIPPGPRVGQALDILLEEVLDDPKKNTEENLGRRIRELGKLSEKELGKAREKARGKKEEFEQGIEAEMKRKHYVK
ncbi:MAG: hypothetical protein A3A43_00695 [Candidatus Liptonbacteria bacterium RIFCSPLOWO2_01_FULL_56_20]|uniref:HD/PDEase domain-containing protein n=1 Tax=Candidatus Liptonbacteria bacterium RIFCSPLOWO2_01_FULL_56_20 TaxID=1798652 RepID=A0A1G2CH23_9BACT|nr:MAG: hypothetical protein A3A43_00695 [Candidatus Liptonbacteria bacterium RIFCSPLOWO2_01_FULL_56_20]